MIYRVQQCLSQEYTLLQRIDIDIDKGVGRRDCKKRHFGSPNHCDAASIRKVKEKPRLCRCVLGW